MDKTYGECPTDSVVVTGIGVSASENLRKYLGGNSAIDKSNNFSHDADPIAYLRQRKTLKFMSKQDRLLLDAAGQAIKSAAVPQEILSHHSSLFLTVGYIPFEYETATKLCDDSMEDKHFSMEKFSTSGIDGINPLLTFACLPNMPAHHVAMNFEIFGSYYITYPDGLQFYLALQEAVCRLVEGEIFCALVGGVADNSNFLVEHHFRKTSANTAWLPADCSACIVLESELSALNRQARILLHLESLKIQWRDNLTSQTEFHDNKVEMGPAALLVQLSSFLGKDGLEYRHSLDQNNAAAESRWRKHV